MFLVLTNTNNKIIFDNVNLNKQNYTLEVKILYEHITCFISKVYPLLKKLTVIQDNIAIEVIIKTKLFKNV